MLFSRQLKTLILRDIYLIWNRKALPTTILRAFLAPVLFAVVMGIVLQALWPSVRYGIGEPQEILTVADAMSQAPHHPKLVFVNAVNEGGLIDSVINEVTSPLRDSGRDIIILRDEEQLLSECRSSLRGVSKCFAAIVFHSSPEEGPGAIWNYTMRADGSFGTKMDVYKPNNDQQVFLIPIQRAVDEAIVSTSGSSLPTNTRQYPYTSKNQREYRISVKLELQKGISNFLAIVFYLSMIGLCYQMVGVVAKEREIGMAQLLETMMPNHKRWQPQVLRLLSHYIAFTLTYAPSWIIIGIVLKVGLFPFTGVGYMLLTIILSGLALGSWSLLGAAFFHKAQMSGIVVVVVSLILGIISQFLSKELSTAAVGVLSFLFTPMTFVFNLIYYSSWERSRRSTRPSQSTGDWDIPGYAFWLFFVAQIFIYPILAALVERKLYSSFGTDRKRHVKWSGDTSKASAADETVRLDGFSKTYKTGLFRQNEVHAVRSLSFSALRGQIVVLLGANGCGKSTTLNTIAGLDRPTAGHITVDGTGGIGICPQKNVLWDNLTVKQHAEIFTDLKSTSALTKTERNEIVNSLIEQCGLKVKAKAMSNTLSGGQKRKLQLICMLTGGSQVCCVDEVSGGLDPLSRQDIWEILFAEKGARTIVLTTHFLDEAEVLADRIVVMSRGKLMAEGSVSELKEKLGGGYRVTMLPGDGENSDDSGDEKYTQKLAGRAAREGEKGYDRTWTADSVPEAIALMRRLETEEGSIQISGPTIEEVFMKLAGRKDKFIQGEDPETHLEPSKPDGLSDSDSQDQEELPLQNGRPVSTGKLGVILFRKRLSVARRNWKPYLAAFVLPIIGTAVMALLIKNFHNPGCSLLQQVNGASTLTLASSLTPSIVVGPPSALNATSIGLINKILPRVFPRTGSDSSSDSLFNMVRLVDSSTSFQNTVRFRSSVVNPGGLFLSRSDPMYAWRGDIGAMSIFSPVFLQNLFDVLTSGVAIVTTFTPFDVPWPPDTGKALQFVFYFGLVMAAFPAFFTLYPNFERVTKVRELQYSNGVRPLPLWAAYALFDWIIIVCTFALVVIVLAVMAPHAFWHIGYLALVLFLYGLTAILFGYNISNLCKSQLSSFAFTAGGSAVLLLLYLVAYMEITTQTTAGNVDNTLLVMHFIFGVISPIGQLLRALIVGLNLFSSICHNTPPTKMTYGGDIVTYGGPVLYLILQSAFLFALLIWTDSHFSMGHLAKFWPFKSHGGVGAHSTHPVEKAEAGLREPEVVAEIDRVENHQTGGLRVLHLNKTFITRKPGLLIKSLFSRKAKRRVEAVDDVTFGVNPGEVLGLLGPNGAGKTTTISMIRGDVAPTPNPETDVLVCGESIRHSLLRARTHLGVCPQFDATDQLTVDDQLSFYARVRGVADVQGAVDAVVRGVGLTPFRTRLAGALSGGNRRKLSLGISLLGNPDVVLLDEPSSGMDPLAKRHMWRILSRVVAGRSILLTTHSMEEADALADRIAVLSRRMLDIGSANHLRRKYGHGFHVHLVAASEPHTTDAEAALISDWFNTEFPGTDSDGKQYHGQMRFNVPYATVEAADISLDDLDATRSEIAHGTGPSPVSSSFTLLGRHARDESRCESDSGTPQDGFKTGLAARQTSAHTMAKLFAAIEKNKKRLGIGFYSVSPTTLDEVFLRVVRKNNAQEEDKKKA